MNQTKVSFMRKKSIINKALALVLCLWIDASFAAKKTTKPGKAPETASVSAPVAPPIPPTPQMGEEGYVPPIPQDQVLTLEATRAGAIVDVQRPAPVEVNEAGEAAPAPAPIAAPIATPFKAPKHPLAGNKLGGSGFRPALTTAPQSVPLSIPPPQPSQPPPIPEQAPPAPQLVIQPPTPFMPTLTPNVPGTAVASSPAPSPAPIPAPTATPIPVPAAPVVVAAPEALPATLPEPLPVVLPAALPAPLANSVAALPASTTGKRIALLIGNSDYPSSPLRNPVNDVRLMAQTLQGLGFEVIEKANAGQRDMLAAISDFTRKIRGGGVALFYYAGHGMQVKGENFLIPVDAAIAQESDVSIYGVNSEALIANMGDDGDHLNIVILDACRDNPFAKSSRSGSRGLADIKAPSGSIIAYATAPGQTASDGDGDNGLYTSTLVRLMQQPGLSLEDLFRQNRKAVLAASGGKQNPWESSSLTDAFVINTQGLNAALVNAPAPVSLPNLPPVASLGTSSSRGDSALDERLAWSQLKDTFDLELLGLFLQKYPKGQMQEAAKQRMEFLRTPQAFIEQMAVGQTLSSQALPMLDPKANSFRFGNWVILRKPSKAKAVVAMLPNQGKGAEVLSKDEPEQWFFYYYGDSSRALFFKWDEDDAEDDVLAYRNRKEAFRIKGCDADSLKVAGYSVPAIEDLEFPINTELNTLAELPSNWRLGVRTTNKREQVRILQRQEKELSISLSEGRRLVLQADTFGARLQDQESACGF
jgi:hypothetical protein